jgi:hypothetical protein
MSKKQITLTEWLRVSALRISRIHFLLILAFAAQIIVFHAGNLVTPEIILQKWLAVAFLTLANTGVWVLAHNKDNDANFYKLLIVLLLVADIIFASHGVYIQRGMASLAVALYAVPIVVSAAMLNRAAIYATAFICSAAYFATVNTYFVVNFNEGYKLQLYGEAGFYSAIFIVLAAFLSAFVKFKDE